MNAFLEELEYKLQYHYHEGFKTPIIGAIFWFFIYFPLINIIYFTWFAISFPGIVIISLCEGSKIINKTPIDEDPTSTRLAFNILLFIIGFAIWLLIIMFIRLFY